jgi:hypothetical protein
VPLVTPRECRPTPPQPTVAGPAALAKFIQQGECVITNPAGDLAYKAM